MNKRQMDIVDDLSRSELWSIASLAARHEVSERTIRKDLNTLDDALRRNGKAGITLERGGRVICMDSPRILLQGADLGLNAYQPTREERVFMEAALIALADPGTTLNNIAEELFISRGTVINDQDAVRQKLAGNQLQLVSKASKGLKAEGSEENRRLFLRDALYETSPEAARMLAERTALTAASKDIVNKVLDEQQTLHDCALTDESLRAIQAYLYVALLRLQGGHALQAGPAAKDQPHDPALYAMAADILELLASYLHVGTNDAETLFLCRRLEHRQFAHRSSERGDAPKVQLLTRRLIARLSDELGIDFGGDFTFFENLSNHLDSVLQPTPVDYPDTPLIREVIHENKAIVQAVRACDDVICSYIGRELSELEIGYIALHVSAAIERRKRRQTPLHAVVVCNSGVGTSQLLAERLRSSFNFQVLRTCTSRELQSMGPAEIDLVISTVPLESSPVDWILVTPLLNEDDTRRISAKVNTLRSSRNLQVEPPQRSGKNANDLLSQLAPVVYDLAPDRAPALMRAVRRVVASYFSGEKLISEHAGQASVASLLPPSHIRLDVPARDWREAVRESARFLLRGGYIEERYIGAMIANIEENGPYVVLTPGFAMPHEGVDAGPLEMGFSLVRLAQPINFGEPDNDPVEFVCCLSATDHNSHLRAFFNLVALMRNADFRSELHQAWTPEQASAIIERWELGLPE